MRILIISGWYKPLQNPRAHRWTAIAEHWAKEGHEIEVLTTKATVHDDDLNGIKIHRIGSASLSQLFQKNNAQSDPNQGKKTSLKTRCLKWFHRHVWRSIHFPDEAGIWYLPARTALKSILKTQEFDVLVTVSMPFTSHLLGLWAKQHYPTLYWIADNGDPALHEAFPRSYQILYHRLLRNIEARILEKADQFVVTHERLKSRYSAQYPLVSKATNIQVIPPLLFPAPNGLSAPSVTGTTVKIGFAGSLFQRVRTPNALVMLANQTIDNDPTWADNLEIHLWGDLEPAFKTILQTNPCFKLHGQCDREETRLGLSQMDALLNIGNSTDYQLPSKVTEYLAIQKPIINLRQVEYDAFEYFFKDTNMVLSLAVAKTGGIDPTSFQQWLSWLSAPKPVWNMQQWAAMVAESGLERVAEAYLEYVRYNSAKNKSD